VGVQADGARLVMVRLGDDVHAYADRCAHLGFALSEGLLEGKILTCAAHHWQYDASTGCGVNPPTARLVRYPVRIEQGQIYVEIDPR
jgi:toluene monooxygenase system ferredoxin subunit